MMKRFLPIVTIFAIQAVPLVCHASLESSMYTLRSQLSTIFMPALSMIGIVLAGISLAMGNPNAKTHIGMAVVGACVGFGADGIIDFARRTFGGV
jgi:hypothetical protein